MPKLQQARWEWICLMLEALVLTKSSPNKMFSTAQTQPQRKNQLKNNPKLQLKNPP